MLGQPRMGQLLEIASQRPLVEAVAAHHRGVETATRQLNVTTVSWHKQVWGKAQLQVKTIEREVMIYNLLLGIAKYCEISRSHTLCKFKVFCIHFTLLCWKMVSISGIGVCSMFRHVPGVETICHRAIII